MGWERNPIFTLAQKAGPTTEQEEHGDQSCDAGKEPGADALNAADGIGKESGTETAEAASQKFFGLPWFPTDLGTDECNGPIKPFEVARRTDGSTGVGTGAKTGAGVGAPGTGPARSRRSESRRSPSRPSGWRRSCSRGAGS